MFFFLDYSAILYMHMCPASFASLSGSILLFICLCISVHKGCVYGCMWEYILYSCIFK